MQNNLKWLEISKSALLNNLRVIRKTIPSATGVIAMVKANAYGHGLDVVTPVLASHVAFFGVNTLEEALEIRKLKLTNRILIAAPIPPSDFPVAVKNHLSLCVHSLDYLHQLSDYKIPIHLKINTGMNRLGLSLIDLLTALEILPKSSLIPEGIYTHFHSSDSDSHATLVQLDQFNQAVYQTKYYFPRILAHCANSAAIFNYPQTHLDLVRPGLAIYGLYPRPKLKPALSFYCHPVQTRNISPDDTVGYSAAYLSTSSEHMAVLPIGYSDGLDRRLGNLGRVWSEKHTFPIVGRIAMNFSAISTSDVILTLSSRVELIGPHITADSLACLTDTINYEIVSRLSPNIPRLLV
jgi:alanine racemase